MGNNVGNLVTVFHNRLETNCVLSETVQRRHEPPTAAVNLDQLAQRRPLVCTQSKQAVFVLKRGVALMFLKDADDLGKEILS